MKYCLLPELETVITLSLTLCFLFVVCLGDKSFHHPKKSNSIYHLISQIQDASINSPSYQFHNNYQHRSPKSRSSFFNASDTPIRLHLPISCEDCLTNQGYGWLDDVSNTGISLTQWHYQSCPLCQCNGHSHCKPTTNHCIHPCQNNTEGPHCERCISGYYGKPMNGGHCTPCQCNGHAEACNRETGKCYCSTKGIIGDNCNICDEQNHYTGNPISPFNETCHYNLTTDYQYIFNMSKPEDHFYSDINLFNVPIRKDSDVDLTIVCNRFALVNITSGTSYRNRKLIHTALECGSFRLRFSHERHALSEANYSFFVRVYDFQTPFVLQVAFSQHRTLYLPQFFFTFSSCFLFFCVLSGIVWKLKHEYDLYNRRQRQFIEMEEMASRPFSSIPLELSSEGIDSVSDLKGFYMEPTPISYQPCFGSNIGVLSFFVQLPGRPNLAIGSTLVNLNDETNTASETGGNNSVTTNKRLEKDVTNLKE